MFSGIVTEIGRVETVTESGQGRQLRIACGYDTQTIDIGASIACAGVCLTVTKRGGGCFEADLSGETLARSTLGAVQVGDALNLERSLRLGDELGGHMVLGHVDGTAQITGLDREGVGWRLRFRAPEGLAPMIAEKGSVTLDGTSLTVNDVEGAYFDVALVPHTIEVTTWGLRSVGDSVNLEIDVLARYVARLAQQQGLEKT
ncbi:MAG: riboflavin synthase [Alphaproteobacteria bacterium]